MHSYRLYLGRPIVFGAIIFGIFLSTKLDAQAPLETASEPSHGILDILDVTIRSDPAAHFFPRDSDKETATLTFKTRISAHSQETNFFGDISTTVSDFNPMGGSANQEVWKDARCHHERGFPKITILSVDGFVQDQGVKKEISARYRWIGLPLPADEVMPSKRLDGGVDNIGPYLASRTETKQSRFFIDLKLHIAPCDLTRSSR